MTEPNIRSILMKVMERALYIQILQKGCKDLQVLLWNARVGGAALCECNVLYTVPVDDGKAELLVKTTIYNVTAISKLTLLF